jgi:hypothetical protein
VLEDNVKALELLARFRTKAIERSFIRASRKEKALTREALAPAPRNPYRAAFR